MINNPGDLIDNCPGPKQALPRRSGFRLKEHS